MKRKLQILDSMTVDDIKAVFLEMPENVTSLDLSGSVFNDTFTIVEFKKIFDMIPNSVISLDWSNNSGGYFTEPTLAQIVALIPATVKSLNLRSNDLYQLENGLLGRVFEALPVSVTSVDISDNSLGNPIAPALADDFSKIPKQVSSLNLSQNSLGGTFGDALARIFTAIPDTVTSIDLSNNGIGWAIEQNEIGGSEVVKCIAGIRASVTSLNLSKNQLNKISADDLRLFSGHFKNIKTLELSLDEINLMTSQQRIAIRNMFSLVLTENIIVLDKEGKGLSRAAMIEASSKFFLPSTLQDLCGLSLFRAGIKPVTDEVDPRLLGYIRSF